MDEQHRERFQFTRITGKVGNVEGMMRLKRLGKIRLGLKVQNEKGKTYPTETEGFVCPPEVEAVYGQNPLELDGVMFASNDPNVVYVEKLALYGSGSGLKCCGNGTIAERMNEQGKWVQRECPCEFLKTDENPKGQCTPQAHLCVILPKVSMWGYYQITTGSAYARAGILSALKHLQDMVGRIGFIPLKLMRIPTETNKGGVKRTHYILSFVPTIDLDQIKRLRASPEQPALLMIDPPVDENPDADPVDKIDESGRVDAEALAGMTDEEMDKVQKALDARKGTATTITPPGATVVVEQGGKTAPPVDTANAAPVQTKAFDLRFDEVLAVIAEDKTLTEIKSAVIVSMGIKGLSRITKQGEAEFIKRFRALAKDRGIDRLPF
jgi:hypothetical protein